MTAYPEDRHEADRRLSDRRSVADAFWDGLTEAATLVAALVLATLGGVWLDGRLDTRPVFTLGLLAFALAGVCVRAHYLFRARFREDDEGKPWARRTR